MELLQSHNSGGEDLTLWRKEGEPLFTPRVGYHDAYVQQNRPATPVSSTATRARETQLPYFEAASFVARCQEMTTTRVVGGPDCRASSVSEGKGISVADDLVGHHTSVLGWAAKISRERDGAAPMPVPRAGRVSASANDVDRRRMGG